MIILGNMFFQADGSHIFQICPSANMYECRSMAIGARSQSARTYLEKHLTEIKESPSLTELMKHALRALRDSSPNDTELSSKVITLITCYLFDINDIMT